MPFPSVQSASLGVHSFVLILIPLPLGVHSAIKSLSPCAELALESGNGQVWRCLSSTCISISKRCDTVKDCDDGSDEQNCPAASQCWQGEFSFARCCLAGLDCWSGAYNYASCCLSHPVLSPADVQAISAGQDHWSCGCDGASFLKKFEGWSWCNVRRSMMLSWNVQQLYVQFAHSDVATLAACPIGALQFMISIVLSKVNMGVDMHSLPPFLWAEELISLLLGPDYAQDVFEKWIQSGWNPFFMLSSIRTVLQGTEGPPCAPDAGVTFLNHGWTMIEGGASVPLPITSAFLASLEGGTCPAQQTSLTQATGSMPEPTQCCVPRALGMLALADSAATGGRQDERQEFLRMAGIALRAGLPAKGRPGSLRFLLWSRWPVPEFMDKLFQQPIVDLSVRDTVVRSLMTEPAGPFHANLGEFQMRLFPRREIVSDMVRFSRVPFCGMRPFMQLVERIAVNANCSLCGLDFVEGGPHIGDCALFATAALQHAGLQPFSVAYEPLPDASSLFRQSVFINGWDGRVVVVPRALAAKDDSFVRLAFFPGHNGEGTTVRASEGTHCGEFCTGFNKIPTVTLDASWPALRPKALEILKLSVNGEELNTIRGARSLLSKRSICSVLVHVTKAKRGWEGEGPPPEQSVGSEDSGIREVGGFQFSSELWELLTQLGGMDLALHLDVDHTGQVPQGDPRPRPSTRLLQSALELDEVFGNSSYSHDYLVARLQNVPSDSPCYGSLALRHWSEVFTV